MEQAKNMGQCMVHKKKQPCNEAVNNAWYIKKKHQNKQKSHKCIDIETQ